MLALFQVVKSNKPATFAQNVHKVRVDLIERLQTQTIYLIIAADHTHLFIDTMASASRIMHPATKHRWFSNGLRNKSPPPNPVM